MMKKFLIILTVFFSIGLVGFADEDWSGYDNIDNAWDGQKSITNKQFEETMDALQANKKRKEAKERAKILRKFKGSSLTPQMDANKEDIPSESPDEEIEEGELLSIPVDIIMEDKIVDRGYYKVIGSKQKDGVYLLLYQAHTLVAKIPARETDDDFSQPAIRFTKLLPVNDHTMKIIYGSLDFNAYAYVDFDEET